MTEQFRDEFLAEELGSFETTIAHESVRYERPEGSGPVPKTNIPEQGILGCKKPGPGVWQAIESSLREEGLISD